MVERNDALISVEDLPVKIRFPLLWKWRFECQGEGGSYHLSHFTPMFPMSAVSVLGRDPPEMAMVNLPRFSIESF